MPAAGDLALPAETSPPEDRKVRKVGSRKVGKEGKVGAWEVGRQQLGREHVGRQQVGKYDVEGQKVSQGALEGGLAVGSRKQEAGSRKPTCGIRDERSSCLIGLGLMW